MSDAVRRALLVFAICAAPRFVALAIFPGASSTYYDELAAGLLSTGSFGFDGTPSTYMEPLYPAFLAGARLVTGDSLPLVLILQIVVASIGGVLLDRLASHHAGPRAGLFAALFYAVYPYLVRQSVALLEITLCTTLAIGTALALSRTDRIRGALVTGALFGLLMLTRTSFAVAPIGAAAWLAWRPRRAGGGSPLGLARRRDAPQRASGRDSLAGAQRAHRRGAAAVQGGRELVLVHLDLRIGRAACTTSTCFCRSVLPTCARTWSASDCRRRSRAARWTTRCCGAASRSCASTPAACSG